MHDLEVTGFPFILVDKVLGKAPGERAIGLRNVTANDPLLASGGGGAGPRVISMRRALIVEAFSQLASYALAADGDAPSRVEVAGIDSMRFVRSPVPGDQIVLTVEVLKEEAEGQAPSEVRPALTGVDGAPGDGSAGRAGNRTVHMACKAEVGGELVARGKLEIEVPEAAQAG